MCFSGKVLVELISREGIQMYWKLLSGIFYMRCLKKQKFIPGMVHQQQLDMKNAITPMCLRCFR